MVRPYSNDLRERLVRAVLRGGLSCHQAAAQFGVAISTAINWVRRFRGTGSVEPDQIGGYRWQTMTFLAALRHDRITAPWHIDGPIKAKPSSSMSKRSCPTLQHGDIVIMDDLDSHKGKAARRAIRGAGARLFYLPKYSPDLNPIEQFFAKVKHWLRKAARRTTETVYEAIGPILDTVTSAECANYFANAGYDQI
jgi:transposase